MDDQFQVVLPSNSSMRYFPDNKTNDYTTKLPLTHRLAGEYEAALIDIQYPFPCDNFANDVEIGIVTPGAGVRRPIRDELDRFVYDTMAKDNKLRKPKSRIKQEYDRNAIDTDHEPDIILNGNTEEGGNLKLSEIPQFSDFDISSIRSVQAKIKKGDSLSLREYRAFVQDSSDNLYYKWPWTYGRTVIPAGYYSSVAQLCEMISVEIRKTMFPEWSAEDSDPHFIKFQHDTIQDRIQMMIKTKAAYAIVIKNSKLAQILGFKVHASDPATPIMLVIRNDIRTSYNPMLKVPQAMFVYADIIKYQTVGDTSTPLLAVLPVKGQPRQTCYWACQPPYYIPVTNNDFESIRIRICTDTGEPYPIGYGKVICRLHLRRKSLL